MSTSKKTNVVELKEVPMYDSLFGYIVDEEFNFVPKALFEAFKVPKEKEFSVDLKPLTDEDKHKIFSMANRAQLELFKYAKDNNIDMSEFGIDGKFDKLKAKLGGDLSIEETAIIKDELETKTINDEDKSRIKKAVELNKDLLSNKDKLQFKKSVTESIFDEKKELLGDDLSEEERVKIRSEITRISLNKIIVDKYSESLDKSGVRMDIVQKYVIGLNNYKLQSRDGVNKDCEFETATGTEYISDKVWAVIHPMFKDHIYSELLRISKLTLLGTAAL
jgi:hypothetical protein